MVKCIAAWSTFKRIYFINIFSSPRNVWKNVILTLHNPLPLIQYILLLILTSDTTWTTWRTADSIRITCPIIVVITPYSLSLEDWGSDSSPAVEHSSSDLTNTYALFKTFLTSALCRTQLWIMNVNILHVLLNSREIKMQQDKSKQKKAKLFLLYWLCKRVAIKWWKQGI